MNQRIVMMFILIFFSCFGPRLGFTAETPKKAGGEAGAGAGGGQSADKLLATLNDALKENRKMRQEMQELRSTSEKLIVERNDIAKQVQMVQQAVMQRERELNKKIADAGGEVENARKEIESLKKANGESTAGRQELEKKLEELNKANEEMKKLLATPPAGGERHGVDPALMAELAQKNAEDIDRAVGMVSGINSENIELKDRLIVSCFNLGNIYYDLGRYQDAIVQYQHALQLNSSLAWAHHNLAVIYDYHLGDMGKAKFHYRQYMALKPAGEESSDVRMRLWDVEQLSRLEPDGPLKKDYMETQRK